MARSENVTGAFFMMASMASFTFNDAVLKLVLKEVPLFQTLFLRGLGTMAIAFALAWGMKAFRTGLSRRDTLLMLLRALAETAAAFFFLTALSHMPLANVTAILQASPLVIALTAALLFRERIGWRRLSAILVGFVGVMLIVRPGASDFSVWSVYALIAVLLITVRDLSTRRLSREVPSMLVTFATACAVTLLSGVLMLGEERVTVPLREGVLIAGATVLVMGGYMFSIMVMRIGEVSFTTPFRYTGLIWALLLGWVVFHDWPRPVTLLGAGIVIASGLFMLYREAQLGLARRRAVRRSPEGATRP